MSFIQCYEPEYVRKFLARHPGSPLCPQGVETEIRLSLSLTDIASCEAVLNDVRALIYSSPTARGRYSAELSARDAIVNQVILSTLTLRDLTPELSLYAVDFALPRQQNAGQRRRHPGRLTTLPLALADHAKKGTLQAQFASSRPCHSWRAS